MNTSATGITPFKRLRAPLVLCFCMTLLFCALSALAPSQHAYAVELTVTSDADTGSGSLRQALVDANDGDTILFAIDHDATITLSSCLVVTDKSFTLAKSNNYSVAINGPQADSIFNLMGSGEVEIKGCTLNGMAQKPLILVSSGQGNSLNLTLGGSGERDDVILIGNSGQGIVFDSNATLTLDARTTITNCFSNSTGAGVQMLQGDLVVKGTCVITDNQTTTEGGGIWMGPASGFLSVKDLAAIWNNTAQYGSDIYMKSMHVGGQISLGLVYSEADFSAGEVPFYSATALASPLDSQASIGVEGFKNTPTNGSILVSTSQYDLCSPIFDFSCLPAGLWAQDKGEVIGYFPKIDSVIASAAPTLSSFTIDTNDITSAVTQFSIPLSASTPLTEALPFSTTLQLNGPRMYCSTDPNETYRFEYEPNSGTITVPQSVVYQCIELAQSALGSQMYGPWRMAFLADTSASGADTFEMYYADFVIRAGDTPSPTPTPTPTPVIPPTSDTLPLVVPIICCVAGILLCAGSLFVARRKVHK